jgi:hypothetical protein
MLWRERKIPYGPVHICLSVAFFLGDKKPSLPGSLLRNNGNCGPIVGAHRCATTVTEVIVGTPCCLTMTSGDDSETMTYVMWCEEQFWNVGVLQRVVCTPFQSCLIAEGKTKDSELHDSKHSPNLACS